MGKLPHNPRHKSKTGTGNPRHLTLNPKPRRKHRHRCAEKRNSWIGKFLGSTPVGALLADHQFVTTCAPSHSTVGAARFSHEVKATQREIYQQRDFAKGPRFAAWQSGFQLRHSAGDDSKAYQTVARSPVLDNALVRALRRRSWPTRAAFPAAGLPARVPTDAAGRAGAERRTFRGAATGHLLFFCTLFLIVSSNRSVTEAMIVTCRTGKSSQNKLPSRRSIAS